MRRALALILFRSSLNLDSSACVLFVLKSLMVDRRDESLKVKFICECLGVSRREAGLLLSGRVTFKSKLSSGDIVIFKKPVVS